MNARGKEHNVAIGESSLNPNQQKQEEIGNGKAKFPAGHAT